MKRIEPERLAEIVKDGWLHNASHTEMLEALKAELAEVDRLMKHNERLRATIALMES